jgi:hypothetical protein
MTEVNIDESRLKKYSEQFERVLENMLQSGIAEYKIAKTYERAKLLSVNLGFQQAIHEFRERWNMEPFSPSNYPSPSTWSESIIRSAGLASTNQDKLYEKLDSEMKVKLCDPFGLELIHDRGLLLVAICFGLTPENILNHWDKLELTAVIDTSPGVTLFVDNSALHTREALMDWLLTIYLARQLGKMGFNLGVLPESLKTRLTRILEKLVVNSKSVDPDKIPQIVEMLESKAQLHTGDDHQLSIRIGADTTLADVQRTWPQVERRQLEIFGPEKPRRRKAWKTYERDIEFQRLYDELDDYGEVVREYDRRHPDTRLVSDNNYTKIRDDVLDLVRQAVKRTRDRMTAALIS